MIHLSAPEKSIQAVIKLGGSKSISNRLLILKALFDLDFSIQNLSDSQDTFLLQQALKQVKNNSNAEIDIEHAGTNMRFLTALLSITKGEWQITGSDRMKQRPIGILVDALRSLGADITYLEKENYPPLLIKGKHLKGGNLSIDSGISSQFISALLLIAPALENGLELTLLGKNVSAHYITLTISMLQDFGFEVSENPSSIRVAPKQIKPNLTFYTVESDWSSASYFYGICALSHKSSIELNFLNSASHQADSVLPKLFNQLGVKTEYTKTGIRISSQSNTIHELNFDCTNCPDIAQTIAVTCFGLGIACHLSGLSTLKIKESDRIIALKTELEKIGAQVNIGSDTLSIKAMRHDLPKKFAAILTYNDHRMAMSFALLSLVFGEISIKDEDVVKKSYPAFWEDLKSLGFNVNLQA